MLAAQYVIDRKNCCIVSTVHIDIHQPVEIGNLTSKITENRVQNSLFFLFIGVYLSNKSITRSYISGYSNNHMIKTKSISVFSVAVCHIRKKQSPISAVVAVTIIF